MTSEPTDVVLWLQVFVAAFLAFLSALWVDHAHDRRASRMLEAALLRAARDAVEANVTLSGQLRGILQAAQALPSFEMDDGLLDVVVPRLAETSPETKLIGEINNWRFQLHHVNRKLDHLLLVVSSLSTQYTTHTTGTLMASLGGSIILTLDNLEKSAKDTVLPAIEARLKVLTPVSPGWGFSGWW